MLTDRHNRIHDYLRISLTDVCNLRCTYCMPDHPVFSAKEKLMNAKEIISIAETFVKLGVRKIRLTGGEPLVRGDFKEIILELAGLRQHGLEDITMTTNGIFVHEYIDEFKAAGIRSLNVSLDTMMPDRFAKITKREHFHRVMSNIHLLMDSNFHVKVNMVVMNGVNDDEVFDFINWTRDYPVHVRFIEFMPFRDNHWQNQKLLTSKELLSRAESNFEVVPLENKKHDTSKKFKVLGYEGTFAFISTMSEPFCGDCNRLRLTADGKMKNCLFSKGEMDLLTALRKGDSILDLIHSSLSAKEKQWGGQELFGQTENRTMVSIGG
ncbi:MAG: GTP 3',8-cyclase MoaA [Bacteroidetes bacterium]|nr:GTP 3',8-cyclase MoaA [Bacteroidota bacterium]MBL0137663.1 GTP 3',8-cyclase MoaA [Bacteroidota bacterium]